jgi:hypothetical protein
MQIGLIIMTLASAGAIVGYGFGVVAPTKRGALGLIIAALAVASVHLILSIIFEVVPSFRPDFGFGLFFGGDNRAGIVIVQTLVRLLFFGEFLLMELFLWAVALNFKAHWAARSNIGLVIFTGCTAGYNVIVPLIMLLFKTPTTPGGFKALLVISLILIWIGVFLIIGMLVWYILQLWRTRDVID